MALSRSQQAVAGLAALALTVLPSFNAAAGKSFAHPLLNYNTGATGYRGDLCKVLSEALDYEGSLLCGGALSLETSLKKGPQSTPQLVTFPSKEIQAQSSQRDRPVLFFVSPSEASWETGAIAFCAQDKPGGNKVVVAGGIPTDGYVFTVPTAQFNSGCMQFLKSAEAKAMVTGGRRPSSARAVTNR